MTQKKWRVVFYVLTIDGIRERSTKWYFEQWEAENKMHELSFYSPIMIEAAK